MKTTSRTKKRARRGDAVVAFPKRQRSARRRPWVIGTIVVVALAMTGTVMWRASEIRVAGAEWVPAEEVLERSGLRGGERMLLTRLDRVERRLEAIPAVAQATVERRLPATIVVRVRERQPVARVEGSDRLVVDATGTVFALSGTGDLPVLEGVRGTLREGVVLRGTPVRVLGAFPSFPASLRARTDRIVVADELALILDGGTRVRFGAPEHIDAKAAAAAAVVSMRADDVASLEYIDVRVPSAPVSRDRSAAEASPEGEDADATTAP